MSLTEFGATKRVWFAPVSNPNDWTMFEARGDAYSKSVAQLGRTVRLGDPVDLGPNSTWRQTSWEGGEDQRSWNDVQMYHIGDADTASERGRIKMNSGLKRVFGEVRTGVSRYAIGRNAATLDATSFDLFFGESNRSNLTTGSPSGGFRMYKFPWAGGTPTLVKSNFASGISAFSPMNDTSPNLYVGSGREVWNYNGSTWTLERTLNKPIIEHGMLTFNKLLYIASEDRLVTRKSDPGGPIYTVFFETSGGARVTGITNWNNRMWFGAVSPGLVTTLYVSDGITANEALIMPGEFSMHGLVPHYGSLYVFGGKPGKDGVSKVGQIWKYTGASMTLLYESGTGDDGHDHIIWDVDVDGPFLVWPESAHAGNDWRVGLMRYDAETDAISHGPGFKTPGQQAFIHNIVPFKGTLHVSVWNKATGDVSLMHVKRLGEVRTDGVTGTISERVISSEYDGTLPAVEKMWLSARVTYRIKEPGASLDIGFVKNRAETPDGKPHVEMAGYLHYDANDTGWRSETIDLGMLRAHTLQYVVELYNEGAADSKATAEVDSIEFNFMPLGERHWQWRMRLIAADGINPTLPTKQSMVDKLESFWGQPLLFAEGLPDGVRPSANGNWPTVLLNEYMEVPYRVRTTDARENADVAIGFTNVGTYMNEGSM